MKKFLSAVLSLIVIFSAVSVSALGVPCLKYTNAGTYPLWTEESYYSSPAVCDIDCDGANEIIFSNYSITVLDAATGVCEWKVNSGYDRNTPVQERGLSNGHTWSDVEIHDINGDGRKEIITGHGGGVISVLDGNGYFLYGWPQQPCADSVRSIEVADLEGDGIMEIVVGCGKRQSAGATLYVYNCDGTVRAGWPQIIGSANGQNGWLDGIYMDSIAIEDLNYDGIKEIIVPSDLSFISVFEPDGRAFPANKTVFGNRNWGHIAFYEDYAAEIKGDNGGWGNNITGNELRESLFKGEFGHAKAVVCDVDQNGSREVIVSTVMCDRTYFAAGYPPTEYMTIGIFNSDRTRYRNDALGYNWEKIPTDLGKPLFQNDVSIVSNVFQVPVVSDIDGDGKNEILFNSYNGKVHCFGLDKKEPYAWPYSLTKRTSPMFEYASPVVCEDLDSDGRKEIIFTSFYDSFQPYNIVRGNLYILNYEGRLLYQVQLPDSKEPGRKSNGSSAAPVLYDVDGDGRKEIIINTLSSGICVYDID